MTMDAMIGYLENQGFKAEKKYMPDIRKYRFTISKNDKRLSMFFEYPTTNPVDRDKKQREFLESMVDSFERLPDTPPPGALKLLTIDDMVSELRDRGFSVSIHASASKDNEHETHFMIMRYGRTLHRILNEYHIGGLKEIQQFRRYFIQEIVETFEREEEKEKRKELKLDYDIRDLYPSTVYASDIISRIIKEKEQEMSNNNIQWKVTNVSIERNDPIRAPEVTAELRAYFKKWPDTLNPMTISDDLSRMLAMNNYADTDSIYEYILRDTTTAYMLKEVINRRFGTNALPKIKKVIFNNPATIVFWADETKTIVKAQNDELFDPEKGLAMAITKKALGNEGNYFETIKKHVTEYQDSVAVKKLFVDVTVADGFKKAADGIKNLAKLLDDKQKKENERSKSWTAYQRLQNALGDKKATKADLLAAMEEACGYLGEGLED